MKFSWTSPQSLVLAIVCCVLMLIGTACDQSEYHKAADAAAKISSSLKAAVDESASLYRTGLIDKDEYVTVLLELDHAQYVNDEYVRQLQSFKTIDSSNRVVIAKWISELTNSVDALNTNGVLHVKNPESQKKLNVYVAAMRSAIQIIGNILGPVPATTTTTVNPTFTAAFAYGG